MALTIGWGEIALRLTLTVIAGFVIGFNRGEHGRPAGMRTTILVCLAASLSMIQANLLMPTIGKAHDSFVVLDLMRLPLGILSGMGFIGAGAIVRRENLVLGVTTAATLWFTTMMGLCFGGGQLALGIAALVLGLGTLWGLKFLEKSIRQDLRGSVTLKVTADGPSEDTVRHMISRGDCKVISWGVLYADHGRQREFRGDVRRRALPDETRPPGFVSELASLSGVESIQWHPQGISQTGGSAPPDQD